MKTFAIPARNIRGSGSPLYVSTVLRYAIYMQDRIEVFRRMLDSDPNNTMVMFGLAKEYEKLGDHDRVIELLETYLSIADDEGNAYGVLANAYLNSGNREKAVETYKKGIDVSMEHGHPSMANEYRMTLDLDLSE